MKDVKGVCVILAIIVLLSVLLCGCVTKTEWYENGQVKSHREGFTDFSDGPGKQLPLSNVSLNGVGISK